jgi:DNA-binding GntR family transcriptional regulator
MPRTHVSPRERRAATRPLALAPASLAIRHENLEDKTYERLRGLLVGRRILPGQRIPVDELARTMGVSRTPVLNALKRLAQEGIAVFHPRRGVYAQHFTKRQMAALFEVREVLEGLAARLAAPRITRDEVARLRALFRGLDLAPTPVAVRRYVERDRRFHWRLVELAGNDQLARAMSSVNMMFFAWQDGLVRPPAETIGEHMAILDALSRHDPEAAEAAMRLHIRRSLARLEQEAAEEESRRA